MEEEKFEFIDLRSESFKKMQEDVASGKSSGHAELEQLIEELIQK